MADDGHTINVGPVTIGEPLPKTAASPIDTDSLRSLYSVRRSPGVHALCDEVDRLRAENTEAFAAIERWRPIVEWAQDAPHHGDCPARHLAGGGTDNFADYVLVAYPCTCGRDEAFARLKADR